MTDMIKSVGKRTNIKSKLIPPLLLSTMIFLLLNAKESASEIRGGLSLVAHTVIPALFPHLVLSDLLVSHINFSSINGRLSRAFTNIFKLPAAAAPIFLIGSICGFPVGARVATDLYTRGILTKSDAELLSAYGNQTSPAFVIAGVGAALFGSVKIGALFFASEILAALICLLISAPKRNKPTDTPINEVPLHPTSFVEAVRRASYSCLAIAGFILFFSLATGIICRVFSSCSLLVSAFFEVTTACRVASLHLQSAHLLSLYTAAFAIGFGGLSAGMQTALCLKEGGLSFRHYLSRKLLQGLFTLFCFFLLTILFPIC